MADIAQQACGILGYHYFDVVENGRTVRVETTLRDLGPTDVVKTRFEAYQRALDGRDPFVAERSDGPKRWWQWWRHE